MWVGLPGMLWLWPCAPGSQPGCSPTAYKAVTKANCQLLCAVPALPVQTKQRRGGLVIQQLSQRLGGLRVYRELSRLLQVSSGCLHLRWLRGLACTASCPACCRQAELRCC